MFITVIVCTYNRHETLVKTLESIAALKIPESMAWEVLVVDNNSTDKTREAIESFCCKDPARFTYLFEQQQGLSHARNTAIRAARGDILAFTDDDAIVEPDWLINLTSALYDGEWVGAGGRIIPVWPRALPSWLSTNDPFTMGAFVAFDLGTQAGRLTHPPYGANMAFRRHVFEKYGDFRVDLGRTGTNLQGREDIEFANRLLANGERLRYEPGAVVHHPVPEWRMERRYVLRWSYWYGRSEIAELGRPEARWLISGVPLHLMRRLVRWSLQWMTSIGSRRRFSSQRNLWYLAGMAAACHSRSRSAAVAAVTCEVDKDGSRVKSVR